MADYRISPKYIGSPPKIPVVLGCVTWLMLDRLGINDVACGIIWTVYAIICLVLVLAPFAEVWVHPRVLLNPKEEE